MKDFLTNYAQLNSALAHQSAEDIRAAFIPAIELIAHNFGKRAFRLQTAFNAAVFDSVMVGISTRLASGKQFTDEEFKTSYSNLLLNPEYLAAVSKATAREDLVAARIRLAISAFSI
jgi:hypothetical protein